MVEQKLERVEEPDDPNRCQAVTTNIQCPYKASPPSKYCVMHGANIAKQQEAKEEARNYRLARYRARVNDFADNPKVKNLREEIGILRMTLEEVLNKCADETDILIHSNKISELVMKIEKLVSSCHKLEQSTSQVLDKAAALQFASRIIEIVGSHVVDPNVLGNISDEILEALKDA